MDSNKARKPRLIAVFASVAPFPFGATLCATAPICPNCGRSKNTAKEGAETRPLLQCAGRFSLQI
jgi:hypothetical protein